MLKIIIAYLIKTVREEHSIDHIGSKQVKCILCANYIIRLDIVKSEMMSSMCEKFLEF